MRGETRRQLIGLTGLLALALGAALLFSPRVVLVRLEALASRPLLFALALCALYLVRPFLLWPVTSVAVLLGYLYGPAVGFVLALLGAAFTALPPYLLGRYADTEFGLFATVSTGCDLFFDAVGDFRGTVAARFSPVPG
ncbi:MAG: TVP38/TMEM64 family protein, partial [Halobacteriota archaeon]